MTERESAVAREILRIAREELRLEVEPVPDEPLAARLDSLALLSLVVAVEDRFRVILGEDAVAGVSSLEDLARVVAARSDAADLPAGDLPPAASVSGDGP